MHVSGDVGVGVQGEGRLGVTQDAGEGLGIYPAGQGVSGEGVSQIVKPDTRQAGILQQSLHVIVGAARADRTLRAEGIWKDPLGAGVLLPFPQQLGRAGRQGDV